MIDYVKTIEKFFVEVEQYLTRRMEQAKDMAEARKIQNTRFQWGMIKARPRKYINRSYDDAKMLSPTGFMRGEMDNSVYLAVRDVMDAIRNMYIDTEHNWTHLQEQHQTDFLNAYKRWKYKSSNSMFKDFIFPFRSAKSLAVRDMQKSK